MASIGELNARLADGLAQSMAIKRAYRNQLSQFHRRARVALPPARGLVDHLDTMAGQA